MPFICYVLNNAGIAASSVTVHTLNTGTGNQITVPVLSQLTGAHGVSLTPQGGCIDKIPQFSFIVPVSVWNNIAAAPGAQILIADTDIGSGLSNPVAQGPVATRGVAVSPDGENATITCDDLLYDLVRGDVTSGFATGEGETTTTTLLRLIGPNADPRLVDTDWTVINGVTGFDGVAFVSPPASVLTAVDNLRVQRFAHWRREAGRSLHFDYFKTPFMENGVALRFQKATPGQTSKRINGIRVITDVQFATDGHVQNSITPVGNGSGVSELTLRTLFGNTTFAGYNPLYPILQRKRADGGGFDSFDYYVEDATSIALYGRVRYRLSKTEIGPVVNATGGVSVVDEQAAAGALYSVGVSELLRRRNPRTELTITTDGWGDFRNIGGQTVRVRYQGIAWDTRDQLHVAIDVDDDYVVLDCVVTEDDTGIRLAKWTLSNDGEPIASAGSFVAGVAGQLSALQGGVGIALLPISKQKAKDVGPGAPISLTIFRDNGMVRQHYMFLYVTLEGVRQTLLDDGHAHDVTTAEMNHDVNALPHDVANLGLRLITSGGAIHDTINGDVTYDPDAHILLSPASSKPASAKPVYFDGTAWYWDGSTRVDTNISESPVTLSIVPATTGGKGGTVDKTTGGAGGTVPQTTHSVGSGVGAHSQSATTPLVYDGPKPTGVTVWVNNVQIGGTLTSDVTVVDLNPYTNGQGQYLVEVRVATMGYIDMSIEGLRDHALLAITPTGT